jgi:hypothetical protein
MTDSDVFRSTSLKELEVIGIVNVQGIDKSTDDQRIKMKVERHVNDGRCRCDQTTNEDIAEFNLSKAPPMPKSDAAKRKLGSSVSAASNSSSKRPCSDSPSVISHPDNPNAEIGKNVPLENEEFFWPIPLRLMPKTPRTWCSFGMNPSAPHTTLSPPGPFYAPCTCISHPDDPNAEIVKNVPFKNDRNNPMMPQIELEQQSNEIPSQSLNEPSELNPIPNFDVERNRLLDNLAGPQDPLDWVIQQTNDIFFDYPLTFNSAGYGLQQIGGAIQRFLMLLIIFINVWILDPVNVLLGCSILICFGFRLYGGAIRIPRFLILSLIRLMILLNVLCPGVNIWILYPVYVRSIYMLGLLLVYQSDILEYLFEYLFKYFFEKINHYYLEIYDLFFAFQNYDGSPL